MIIVPAFFKLKDLIKIIYTAYLVIFIIGLIEFVGAILHIEIISLIIQGLSNILPDEKAVIVASHSGFPRIRSVLEEPGGLGQFIAVNMPIIYSLSRMKYKIYKSLLLNKIIKNIMLPFMWLNLLLTQSPIYIIICTIVTLLYFAKDLLKLLVKHKIFFISLFSALIMVLLILQNTIDIERTPLIRVVKVVSIFSNFSMEKLIAADVSLAGRICSYINQFCIFLNYPIFGIGFGNQEHIVLQQLLHSPVPLTTGIALKMQANRVLLNSNALYLLLYQTGIIGYGLYCLFMVKTITMLRKMAKFFTGEEYYFIDSLSKTLICYLLISSIYNAGLFQQFLWFYSGLVCSIYIIVKKRFRTDFSVLDTIREDSRKE